MLVFQVYMSVLLRTVHVGPCISDLTLLNDAFKGSSCCLLLKTCYHPPKSKYIQKLYQIKEQNVQEKKNQLELLKIIVL